MEYALLLLLDAAKNINKKGKSKVNNKKREKKQRSEKLDYVS